MDKIEKLLESKGDTVYSAGRETAVLEAVKQMVDKHIGALLILEEGEVLGIFTERDAMTRILLQGLDPSITPVGKVMTTNLTCVALDTPIREAMAIMTNQRCRHLPVLNDGQLVGLVSIGDCTRWVSRNQDFTIKHLTDYVKGNYPG